MRLLFYEPQTVFAARVNNATIAKGEAVIDYDTVTVGAYTNVMEDMTLWVGSTPGGREYGKIRVRWASSTQLRVGRNDNIRWADNAYLTVLELYEPWGVFHRIEGDAADPNSLVFYKDDDLLYVDQNVDFDPVVCMGGNRAVLVGHTINWSKEGTYLPTAGTLPDYTWRFRDGILENTSNTPEYGNYTYNKVGCYTTDLTVSASTGKTFTGHRHVVVYDPNGEAGLQARKWGLLGLDASRDQGFWRARVWMRDQDQLIFDGMPVMLVAEDRPSTINDSNMVMTGYIQSDTITYNAIEERMEFVVVGLGGILDDVYSYGYALDDIEAPYGWLLMQDITFDKALVHYMRWSTTLLRLADYHPLGDTRLAHYNDFAMGSVGQAIKNFCRSKMQIKFVTDRDGDIWVERDINHLPVDERPTTQPFVLEDRHWRGKPRVQRVRRQPISYLEAGGVYWTADPEVDPGALLAAAPGNVPAYIGANQKITGLTVTDQDDLNEWVGNIYADYNNEFPEIVVAMSTIYRGYDLAPQGWTYLDTRERFDYDLQNTRLIAQRMTGRYESAKQMYWEEVTFKAETVGVPGDTIIIPVEPLPVTDEQPNPDPIPVIESDGTLTYVATSSQFRRTFNFSNASPSWKNITGGISGTIVDFVLDPYQPKDVAYVLTTQAVWKTNTLQGSTPLWTRVLNITDHWSSTRHPQFGRIRATVSLQDRIYATAYAETSAGSGTYDLYVFRTSDGGGTWSKAASGATAFSQTTWTFDADEEGWVAQQANMGWSSNNGGELYGQSPSGWNDRYWRYTFAVADRPTAVTGQTFTAYTKRGSNFFENIRIYYTDGSWDGSSWDFSHDWAALTISVTAGNNGKLISYFELGGPMHSTVGVWEIDYITTSIITTMSSLSATYGFDVGQKDDPNKVYVSDANNVYQSTNGGTSWSTYIAALSAVDINCHYDGNPSSNNLTLWKDTGGLYRTNGATPGSALLTEASPANVWGRVMTYTNDERVIYALECTGVDTYRIRRTIDRGNVWATGVSGITGARAIGLWPWGVHDAATQKVYWLDSTHIRYSSDGGGTQQDKTGDWTGFANPVMIVPQWML